MTDMTKAEVLAIWKGLVKHMTDQGAVVPFAHEIASRVRNELLDRLEAAEKERDAAELMSLALRAKVAEMEQQEPVGEIVAFGESLHEVSWNRGKLPPLGAKLYLLPVAQPAPSVPDGFAWPECPKRRQSHVLFDDGYEGGWAACVATIKAALAAPEAKP